MKRVGPALVADIGATNARFALVDEQGAISAPRLYALKAHASIFDALDAYFAEENPPASPRQAVLAIAAPIIGDRVAMTNHPWTFSIEEIRRRYGLTRLQVINDAAGNALAIPLLTDAERVQVGSGAPVLDAPIAVIGPGTGLGVCAVIPTNGRMTPLPGEGGHMTMPAADAREAAVLDLLRRRYGHVSAERVLSGPGLVNLYSALCELSGASPAPLEPAQITGPTTGDACAREAVQMFCAMLGVVAGNLALAFGARGGVFIAGGIVPRLGGVFAASTFRERFEAKGRLRTYLASVPTYVVTRPLPALAGAATLL